MIILIRYPHLKEDQVVMSILDTNDIGLVMEFMIEFTGWEVEKDI